jgi:4-hydroxy-4-methyl-2-oxoglutarate aldolase
VSDAMKELAEAGVATVYEAYGRRGLIEGPWDVVTPGRGVAGPARTAFCGPGDNRAVHEVMAHVQPGEVIVLTMHDPEPVALVGELLATQAIAQGAVGVLVDAAVRDCAQLADMGLTTLTRWRHVRGATKNERGRVNVDVTVGGTVVRSGDIVVLDDDGATSVRAEDVDGLLDDVRARIEKERGLLARWEAGELSYDAYGLRAEDEGNRS